MSDIEHEAPERIWAYAGSFKMWRDHQTDQPHTQTEYVRVDHIEELEAKLAKAREEGFWAGRSCGGSKKEIDAALAELKGQDDE